MKQSAWLLPLLIVFISAGSTKGQVENRSAAEKYNEARSLFTMGKYEEAKALLIDSIRLEPGNYLASHLLGMTYSRLQQPLEAIKQFEAATRFNQNYYRAFSAMADIYFNTLGDSIKAEECYLKACEVSETVGQPYARAFLNLGKLYFAQATWEKAVQALQQASLHDPDDEQPFIYLGRIQMELGDLDQAVAHLVQAATLDSTSFEPLLYHASILNRMGQYQQAVEKANEALERMPGSGGILLEIGLGFQGLEQWDEALKALEEAKNDPEWRQKAERQIELLRNVIPPTRIPPIQIQAFFT